MSFLDNIPPVVKNLMVLNVVFYIVSWLLALTGFMNLFTEFSLYYFDSAMFKPFQIVTHMFMHDPTSIWHILFNMFALFMFGRILEQVWGPKRFLIFYLVCGLGGAIVHIGGVQIT